MSRRKQSNPRQFKRLLEACAGGLRGEGGVSEERGASAHEGDPSPDEQPSDDVRKRTEPDDLTGEEESEPAQTRRSQLSPPIGAQKCWDGPGELEAVQEGAELRVFSRQALPQGTSWGPYEGKLEMTSTGSDMSHQGPVSMVIRRGPRWLQDVTSLAAEGGKTNCVIYSKRGELWCTTTRAVSQGEELTAYMDWTSHHQPANQTSLSEGVYPAARLLESMQLLPQQAAMATILPNAIVNKDIFLCQVCGIWFRSERNLQAHLMYYCSGRHRDPGHAPEPFSMTPPAYPQGPGAGAGPGPGQQAVDLLLSFHNGVKTAVSALRCSLCDHTADAPSSLQKHVLSHLSPTGHLCPHCPLSFPTARALDAHSRTHVHAHVHAHTIDQRRRESQSPGCGLPWSEGSPRRSAGAGSPRTPRAEQGDADAPGAGDSRPPQPRSLPALRQTRPDSRPAPSPDRRLSPPEPSSPGHASSPAHRPLGPAFPLPHFLPHFPFPRDVTSPLATAAGPQASEILAKMSELVHRRLRHGGNGNYPPPPLLYGPAPPTPYSPAPAAPPLLPKGAACFQCGISFASLENYLVHKKHYCEGRWRPGAPPPPATPRDRRHALLDKLLPPAPGSPEGGGDPCALPPPRHARPDLGGSEWRGVQGNAETPPPPGSDEAVGPALPEEEEEEGGEDGKTTCRACRITFSRSENYLVHKQFYCATRHDAHARRGGPAHKTAAAAAAAFRTRKRRRNAPSHPANQERPGHPSLLGIGPIGGGDARSVFDDRGYPFPRPGYGVFLGAEPRHPEAGLPAPRSAPSSSGRGSPAGQSEPDAPPPAADAPMDLSRRPPPHGKMAAAAARLAARLPDSDYHECAVCRIGFHRVEDYLRHKHGSCPSAATASSPAVSPQISPPTAGAELATPGTGSSSESDRAELCLPQDPDSAPSPPLPPLHPPPPSKKPRRDGQMTMDSSAPSSGTAARQREGEVARRQSPTEACEGQRDQPGPEDALTQNGRPSDACPSQDGRRRLSGEGAEEDDAAVNSDLSGGQGQGSGGSETGSPGARSPSPSRSAAACVRRGVGVANVKYCRPCDIQFNNLSNFITHKKFYCSSHTHAHAHAHAHTHGTSNELLGS